MERASAPLLAICVDQGMNPKKILEERENMTMSSSMSNIGLKEWAVVINALETGRLIFLLRKGGIREHGREFSLPYRDFLLYPTYEHQRDQLLKREFRNSIVKPDPVGDTVNFNSWARIHKVLKITEADVVERLNPFHIWEKDYIVKKVRWKPRSPLYVICLRVYRLANPQSIPYSETYGGCRSWVSLETDVLLEESTPALDDESFDKKIGELSCFLDVTGQVFEPNVIGR